MHGSRLDKVTHGSMDVYGSGVEKVTHGSVDVYGSRLNKVMCSNGCGVLTRQHCLKCAIHVLAKSTTDM